MFAFWRQSINRDQSIFAIHNISREPQVASFGEIDPIGADEWVDLIRGSRVEDRGGRSLWPYQCAWLTNLF